MRILFMTAFCVLGLAACDQDSNPAQPGGVQQESSIKADQWIGRWNGPEGTYLNFKKNPETGQYSVEIATLDGPKTYDATVTTSDVSFTRGGVEETIHEGDGKDTGMKWLADKTSCLVVKTGEGYCR